MARELIRQGGRSARIQKEVHAASRALLAEMDRGAITVPMIAERAGVTPSTIYRRWGGLAELLADVAMERLRPISDPDDTGSTAGDLEAFTLQYAEEMSSPVGRAMLLDILSEPVAEEVSARCCRFTEQHLTVIAARAAARGEPPLDVPQAVDVVIAPICYHILFADRAPDAAFCRRLLARLARESALPARTAA